MRTFQFGYDLHPLLKKNNIKQQHELAWNATAVLTCLHPNRNFSGLSGRARKTLYVAYKCRFCVELCLGPKTMK